MNNILKEEARKHGDRLQFVAVEHLEDLQRDIEEFRRSEDLNPFQEWIVKGLYNYLIPELEFPVKSIIMIAAHHPFSADIVFAYKGKTYRTRSLVHAEFADTKRYVLETLNRLGYHAHEVYRLPMKRLAVQGGLAVYGRNNITYVEELGSSFSYITFYSDAPCETDEWRTVCYADFCDSCNACISQCPTGAIRQDRFLIDNQRCLSAMNEGGDEFPDWLPKDVHHTLYDCLRCQENCPLNTVASKDIIGPFCFTEEETQMLLDGNGLEAFSEEFRTIADKIGLFDWKQGLPRNISAVMEVADLETH